MTLFPDEWLAIFVLETPLLELVARGSALYLGILVLMRLMPRRAGADLATMDLIFALLIAEAAAHSLGDYTSVADAVVLIATLMGWNYAVNLLSYHVRVVERFVSSPPTQIIRNGRILWNHMRQEYVTEQELISHLRQHGIDDVKAVKAAFVEGEGRITVIGREGSK
jgi:uncharacterized membrane protein YcaP (DUF421 family)